MSTQDCFSPAPSAAPLLPDRDAVNGFVSALLDIARAIDLPLARVLTGDDRVDALIRFDGIWTSRRRKGLELCLSMLRYARPEAEEIFGHDRYDLGLSYIKRELARLNGTSVSTTRH